MILFSTEFYTLTTDLKFNGFDKSLTDGLDPVECCGWGDENIWKSHLEVGAVNEITITWNSCGHFLGPVWVAIDMTYLIVS